MTPEELIKQFRELRTLGWSVAVARRKVFNALNWNCVKILTKEQIDELKKESPTRHFISVYTYLEQPK